MAVTFPSQVLAVLSGQHLAIRNCITRCEGLAADVDEGLLSPAALWEQVDTLRRELEAHNRFEERTLRDLLYELDSFGGVRVERMCREHRNEHVVLHDQLDAATTTALRAGLRELREHLEEEERVYLTRRVLHDDLIVIEAES